jgi:hypothetical protein
MPSSASTQAFVNGWPIARAGNTLTVTNRFHRVTLAAAWTLDSLDHAAEAKGQPVDLLFVNAGTIRNNGGGTGNIRTRSGASRAVAANEIVTFVWDADAAVWRETGSAGAGLELIDEQQLGADAGFIDFSSIPQAYTHLLVVASLRTARVDNDDNVGLRFNNDSAGNYNSKHAYHTQTQTTWQVAASSGGESSIFVGGCAGNNAVAGMYGTLEAVVSHYRKTDRYKNVRSRATHGQNLSPGEVHVWDGAGVWESQVAITQLTIISRSSVNLKAGSLVSLYGMKGE